MSRRGTWGTRSAILGDARSVGPWRFSERLRGARVHQGEDRALRAEDRPDPGVGRPGRRGAAHPHASVTVEGESSPPALLCRTGQGSMISCWGRGRCFALGVGVGENRHSPPSTRDRREALSRIPNYSAPSGSPLKRRTQSSSTRTLSTTVAGTARKTPRKPKAAPARVTAAITTAGCSEVDLPSIRGFKR